jgi:hypothetical protein
LIESKTLAGLKILNKKGAKYSYFFIKVEITISLVSIKENSLKYF